MKRSSQALLITIFIYFCSPLYGMENFIQEEALSLSDALSRPIYGNEPIIDHIASYCQPYEKVYLCEYVKLFMYV